MNTYDDAFVTLGPGFAHAQLSAVMERFFATDPAARDMFLDVGVSFAGGKLLIVNTDNGGIEADDLRSPNMTFNARKIMAMSKPILSLYVSVAEDATHGQELAKAQIKEIKGFNFGQGVADRWTDLMAVRLVAHLIHFRGSVQWPRYEAADGNVKAILKVFATEVPRTAQRDPAKGNALVVDGKVTAMLLEMAGGKVKTALDAPTSAPLPGPVAPGSLDNVLLLTDPKDATKFFRVTF